MKAAVLFTTGLFSITLANATQETAREEKKIYTLRRDPQVFLLPPKQGEDRQTRTVGYKWITLKTKMRGLTKHSPSKRNSVSFPYIVSDADNIEEIRKFSPYFKDIKENDKLNFYIMLGSMSQQDLDIDFEIYLPSLATMKKISTRDGKQEATDKEDPNAPFAKKTLTLTDMRNYKLEYSFKKIKQQRQKLDKLKVGSIPTAPVPRTLTKGMGNEMQLKELDKVWTLYRDQKKQLAEAEAAASKATQAAEEEEEALTKKSDKLVEV